MAKDKQTIEEKAEQLIAEHQQKYTDALAEARAAADTTTTAAWRENYANEIISHRKATKAAAESVALASARIIDWDSNEDTEKEIRDSVKEIAEERIRHQAWKSRTVYPFSNKVERCDDLLRTVYREAETAEQNAPLINRGLIAAVSMMTDKWPRATWDEKTGTVTIADKNVGEARKAN